MRKTVTVIVGSILFLIVALSVVSGDFLLPYSFAGNIYGEDGKTVDGVKITITNHRTNDQLSCITTQNGEYQLSASSFASGYEDGDICDYVVIHNNTIKVNIIEIDTSKGGTVIDFRFGTEKAPDKELEEEDVSIVAPSFSFMLFAFALVFAYLLVTKKEK